MDSDRAAMPPTEPADQPADSPASVVVRLDDPGSLVEAVPHLIGFVPHDSLIVVLFTTDPFSGRARSVGTVRMDLPPPPIWLPRRSRAASSRS